jgi:hypothetical protein
MRQTKTTRKISREMRECIQNCQGCHAICMETMMHCLQMGGQHADPDHIGLMADCAEICQTSANFMLRGSEMHHRTCGVCADVCRRCADDCERIDPGDEMMQRCAEMCRRCAESCTRMSQSPM